MLTRDDLSWDEKLWVSFRHVNGTPIPSWWRAGKRQSQPPGGGVPAQMTWYPVEKVWGGYYNGKSFNFDPHCFGHREKTGWMTILPERQGRGVKGIEQIIKKPEPTKGKTLLELLAEDELG